MARHHLIVYGPPLLRKTISTSAVIHNRICRPGEPSSDQVCRRSKKQDKQSVDSFKAYTFQGFYPVKERTFPVAEELAFFDLEEYQKQQGSWKKIHFHMQHAWPKDLIYLCHWGCGFFSYLHAPTGHVYYMEENYLLYQTNSLEEWLERWLQGEDLELAAMAKPWCQLPLIHHNLVSLLLFSP